MLDKAERYSMLTKALPFDEDEELPVDVSEELVRQTSRGDG